MVRFLGGEVGGRRGGLAVKWWAFCGLRRRGVRGWAFCELGVGAPGGGEFGGV